MKKELVERVSNIMVQGMIGFFRRNPDKKNTAYCNTLEIGDLVMTLDIENKDISLSYKNSPIDTNPIVEDMIMSVSPWENMIHVCFDNSDKIFGVNVDMIDNITLEEIEVAKSSIRNRRKVEPTMADEQKELAMLISAIMSFGITNLIRKGSISGNNEIYVKTIVVGEKSFSLDNNGAPKLSSPYHEMSIEMAMDILKNNSIPKILLLTVDNQLSQYIIPNKVVSGLPIPLLKEAVVISEIMNNSFGNKKENKEQQGEKKKCDKEKCSKCPAKPFCRLYQEMSGGKDSKEDDISDMLKTLFGKEKKKNKKRGFTNNPFDSIGEKIVKDKRFKFTDEQAREFFKELFGN